MPQFLFDTNNIQEDKILLSSSEAHHLLRVLRKTPGDEITLSDGEGKQYYCIIDKINLELPQASLKILKLQESKTLKPSIHLACALLKNQRMDWLIEKTTELGIDEISPLISQHCVVELKSEKDKLKKQERFVALSESALKQSKTSKLPLIHKILNFRSFLENTKTENTKIIKILFHPYHSRPLSELEMEFSKNGIEECLIFMGPEGGFSEAEVKQAEEKGFKTYSLGKNILRGETAAIYALSVLSYWRTKVKLEQPK